MSLDKKGFLSTELENWKKQDNKNFDVYFKLFSDFNEFAQTLAFQLKIHDDNSDELFITCLYIRCLSTYQAIFILLENGMLNEAKVLLRTLIEILFQIVAICKNKDFSKEYIYQDSINRKILVKKTLKYNEEAKKNKVELDLNELLQKVELDIKNNSIKEFKTIDYAKKANLLDFYYTAYALLSSTVHANSRDIESHLLFDKQGIVTSFNWGPADKGIELLLFTGIETIYIILSNLIEKFNLKKNTGYQNLEQRYIDQKAIYKHTHYNSKK